MLRNDLKGLTKTDILKLVRKEKYLLKRDYSTYRSKSSLCSNSAEFLYNIDRLIHEGHVEELLYKEYKEKHQKKIFEFNEEIHVLTKVFALKNSRRNKIEALLETL